MNKIMKNKKSLQLVTSHSSGYKTSSDKINFLISDDDDDDDDDDDMIYIYADYKQ